ncbi:auxin-repressed protein [Musa troglodytarum]|uniref:Auxin-repressed protein n=1 Tax=Musa troglodytarum TaxID=320322 RepID=A0A9E7EJI1_9LILI|nr:auxin-repressed protein [Musa troglodytarum]
MGLLDKLWDDTLAGPRPESGLGRLRKYSSFAFRPASSSPVTAAAAAAAKDEAATGGSGRPYGEGSAEEEAAAPRVTRSIMIKRPAGWASPGGGTPPSKPGGSTPPVSPFSGAKLFRRKSMSDAQGWTAEAVGVEATTSSCPPFEL